MTDRAGWLRELFVTDGRDGEQRLARAADAAAAAASRAQRPGPRPVPLDHRTLAALAALDPCPEDGAPLGHVLEAAGPLLVDPGVRPADPLCAAHLHCAPLLPAVAAELVVAATNQSMDSFDQAPAATHAEDRLVTWLAALLGLGERGSGVMTSGGTASNLLGLMLARERAAARAGARPGDGLPAEAAGWRIVASDAAHDSVRRSAALLGLGARAVAPVATDARGRADVAALDRVLAAIAAEGGTPIAVVGTAGTTDLGAIDPLGAMAERARAAGAWFHVDAAVCSAFALSPRLRPRLTGLELADSVTADFHKLWWMPIAASALVVPDAARLAAVHHHSDYLNRADDEDEGVLNLVGRSLDTSRRYDALKVIVALRTVGRRRMAEMLERVVGLAERAAEMVRARPGMALVAESDSVMMAFRWCGAGDVADEELDRVNTAVQRRLLESGRAVLGRSRRDGRVILKLTLINPLAGDDDVARMLDLVAAEAARGA